MGDDEYHPISRTGSNLTKAGGIGYTVIDSIDTMLLMGLHNEHVRAMDWVTNKMSLDRDDKFNTFEVIPFLCDCDSSMIKLRNDVSIDDHPCSRWIALSVPPLLRQCHLLGESS